MKHENGISAFVEPALLSSDALESNVNKNFNMITLFGVSVGRLSFYGQGAGKYPTGNALAQDIIDIVNGARSVRFENKQVNIDNSLVTRKYYIRTNSNASFPCFASEEVINGSRYIITNEISVSYMHEIAKIISEKDPASFYAGIEE